MTFPVREADMLQWSYGIMFVLFTMLMLSMQIRGMGARTRVMGALTVMVTVDAGVLIWALFTSN